MVTQTETQQYLRQAPFIEAQQKTLLDKAAGVRDLSITQAGLSVAGLDPLTQQARGVGAGLGQYQPLLNTGQKTVGSGLATLQNMGQGVGQVFKAGQGTVAGAIQGLGRGPAGAGALGQAQTAIQGAGGQFAGGPGYQAQQFGGAQGYGAQGFDPNTISQFQNPFEDQAVQQALSDIRRQGDIATNRQDAAAVQAGAFGGSRQGIERTELARNVLEQQGRTAAGMRQAGFQNAAQQAQASFADQQRRQQAQAQFGTQTGQQAFEDAQRRQQAESQFGAQTGQQAFEDAQRRQQGQAQFGTQTGQQGFEDFQRRQQGQSQFDTQSGQQAFEAARNRQLQMGQQFTGLGGAQSGQQSQFAQTQAGLGTSLGSLGQAQAQEAARLGLGIGSLGTTQANIANLGQSMLGQQAQVQSQLGALGQQTQQRQFDADYQQAVRQQMEPYQRLGWMSDILKPTIGSASSSLTAATAPSPSGMSQLVGAGVGALGLNQAIGNPLGGMFGK